MPARAAATASCSAVDALNGPAARSRQTCRPIGGRCRGEPSAPISDGPGRIHQAVWSNRPNSDTEAVQGRLARWLPILISGSLFALAHAGQGPAPIPLFFLGLGLGYLYQRTHRILPCIVVHFLVNSTAVVQLALYVAQQSGTE